MSKKIAENVKNQKDYSKLIQMNRREQKREKDDRRKIEKDIEIEEEEKSESEVGFGTFLRLFRYQTWRDKVGFWGKKKYQLQVYFRVTCTLQQVDIQYFNFDEIDQYIYLKKDNIYSFGNVSIRCFYVVVVDHLLFCWE